MVMRREIVVKLTDRTFIVSTLVTLVLIGAFIAVQAVVRDRSQHYTLVATPGAVTMADAVAARAPDINGRVTMSVTDDPDAAAARSSVTDGSADAWLHHEADAWVLTTRSGVSLTLQTITAQVVRETVLAHNAEAAGTTVARLQQGSALRTTLLDGAHQDAALTKIVGFAFAFLFYIASLLFGIQLAGSVVEEKQSRIVEIIATSIPVRQLLAGKVAGNTVLAVGQLALYTLLGLVGLGATAYRGVLSELSGAVAWFLVFFLAGFVALASLWAVAGSLASRNEDLQSTTPPLTMLVMGMFFGGLFLGGTAQTVASFVPPLSAVLMPIRLLQGTVPWWQPALALVLLLCFAGVTVVLGERVYRRALLQTQGRVGLRQAWSAEE